MQVQLDCKQFSVFLLCCNCENNFRQNVCSLVRTVRNCEANICMKQLFISLLRGCYSVPSFGHTLNIELLYLHRIVSVAELVVGQKVRMYTYATCV